MSLLVKSVHWLSTISIFRWVSSKCKTLIILLVVLEVLSVLKKVFVEKNKNNGKILQVHSVDEKTANAVVLHSSQVLLPSYWPCYRKLSSTSGVPEEPSRASFSLLSSSRSSSGRVSAVSCDNESVSSSRARELKK